MKPLHLARNQTPQRKQAGVVLLIILLFVFVTTLAAGSMVQMIQTQAQREKEEQLLFVGDQFRRAIVSYYNTVPSGSARALPTNLEDLISDPRFPTPIQHLRKVYKDPMTGSTEWGLVTQGGGISGVYSQSPKTTFKTTGFAPVYKAFEGKTTYSDWKFVAKLN